MKPLILIICLTLLVSCSEDDPKPKPQVTYQGHYSFTDSSPDHTITLFFIVGEYITETAVSYNGVLFTENDFASHGKLGAAGDKIDKLSMESRPIEGIGDIYIELLNIECEATGVARCASIKFYRNGVLDYSETNTFLTFTQSE